ncbi:Biotin-requiring enzyme [Micromonospora inositola]|uniref:Biotin-requiring enzyme n=1 Tax=Micromonospora inositola TaxID=47865 RepID=A0A1C5JFG5_9ACTN|nr:Biotin-requiring enzyme [Micromonospora inositola]
MWHVGVPLFIVALSAGLLLAALFVRGEPPEMSRGDRWMSGLVCLTLAGDAAFGDSRPAIEREWKGAAALFAGLALAIQMWRHYAWRRRSAREPSPVPPAAGEERPAGEVTPAETALGRSEAMVLTMPVLGERVTEGTVTRWLKQVGDTVAANEPLLEVSTDKVDTEIPAPTAGTLLEIKVAAQVTVPAGATLAVIGAPPRELT